MIRAGQRFGGWTIEGSARLGGGGNGQVWTACTVDGRTGAIKILSQRRGREGTYRLARFKDEISFLIKFPNFPGVLPMLDSHISEDPADPSWYVMPVAIPIRKALGSDPEPMAVIAAMTAIASALSALTMEGVFHRDIKPDNLFKLGEKYVVGDFGLVTYPEKEPQTEHGRKLGPTDYMAPEMRADADHAEPGPADVWALGKTLWVLLTGQELPLPGTHNPIEPAHALRERITYHFAAELDLLLARATRINPDDRLTMMEFVDELQACLSPPPETTPSASLEDLATRAATLVAVSRQSWQETENIHRLYNKAWKTFRTATDDIANELSKLLTFGHSYDGGRPLDGLLEHSPSVPFYSKGIHHDLFPPHHSHAPLMIVVSMAMRAIKEGGPFDLAARITVNRHLDRGRYKPNEIYQRTWHDIPAGSVQEVNVAAEIRAEFTRSLDPIMRKAISILEEMQ
jgi:serine/threonine protein kinase